MNNLKTTYYNMNYELVKGKQFIWKRGDHEGNIVSYESTLKEENDVYVVFNDNSRISLDFMDTYLEPYISPVGTTEMSQTPNYSVINSSPSPANFQSHPPQFVTLPHVTREEKDDSYVYSPVFDLLDKAKKQETALTIHIITDMISNELFNILIESYKEDKDLIIDKIVENAKPDIIKQIKNSILDFYKSNE